MNLQLITIILADMLGFLNSFRDSVPQQRVNLTFRMMCCYLRHGVELSKPQQGLICQFMHTTLDVLVKDGRPIPFKDLPASLIKLMDVLNGNDFALPNPEVLICKDICNMLSDATIQDEQGIENFILALNDFHDFTHKFQQEDNIGDILSALFSQAQPQRKDKPGRDHVN